MNCLVCRRPVDPHRRPLVFEATGDAVCNRCLITARLGSDWLVDLSREAGLSLDISDAGRRVELLDLHPGRGRRVLVL